MKKTVFNLIISISACMSLYACSGDEYKIPVGSDAIPSVPSKVEVLKNSESGKWEMLVNGETYYINGAACNNFYTSVSKFGGNTIRLYSCNSSSTRDSLDMAYQAGLMVNMGLSLKRERDGFDYNDEAAVAEQKANIQTWVKQYKDHPAVLCWSIGNEADSEYTNKKLWTAINEIAAMIHEIDPNHPTTTALASPNLDRVQSVRTMAPEIDILSINCYSPTLPNLLKNLQDGGWEKPYMVTEFGPRGTWQLNAVASRILPWGALVEQTSTEKAEEYKTAWTQHIKANQNNGCIGSFVFLWGYQKHGEVLGWYGLFTKDKYSFPGVDVMQECWTGTAPSAPAPVIADRSRMTMNGQVAEDAISVAPGSENSAKVEASTTAEVQLRYRWFIFQEGDSAPDGSMPDGITGLISNDTVSEISFKAPSQAGGYRLYVYVFDDVNKKAASACIPFKVE